MEHTWVTVELGLLLPVPNACQEMTCQLQINIALNNVFELFLDMEALDLALERWLRPFPSPSPLRSALRLEVKVACRKEARQRSGSVLCAPRPKHSPRSF